MSNVVTYDDYKYFMQDASSFYVGAKYTLGEICTNEEILFRFRKVVAESILNHADKEDTLETHLYYLEAEDFAVQIYKQMKARIKVCFIKEKKSLLGKKTQTYVTKFMDMDELVSYSKEDKERIGLVIQELKASKLALMTV